ncbi:MAG: SH3 domain-containing protein [Anaerolineae bacterium]|nr:SH3 domain-containing protein [Anaerolineae bacterium]
MQGVMFAGVLMPLPYIVYAVIQTVRGKLRITGFGTLLAYVAVLIPLIIIAIQTVNDAEPAILTMAAVASGAVVALFSLILLIRDLRRPDRSLNHSYSILGLGVGLLVIAGTLLTPTVLAQVDSVMGVSAASDGTGAATTSGFPQGSFSAPELTADMASSSLIQTIASASGLTGEQVIEQINSDASIQTMVTDGGGDVAPVTSALASAVQKAIDDGTLNSQMLTRFGGDAATFASQIVSGELPAQLGRTMLAQIISGGTALPDAGSFAAPSDTAGTGTADTTTGTDQAVTDLTTTDQATGSSERPAGFPEAPAGFAMPGAESSSDSSGNNDGGDSGAGAAQPEATEAASATPTSTPAPTSTPQPTSTPFPTFEPTSTVAPVVTCSVLVNFNLNLRSGPSADADLLLTIPFGTIVKASAHNEDDWWQVTYEDVEGWISGEYVTIMAGCEL